jgi:regulator of protease activity HflC (stomatin/prohibitin superfamily)
MKENRALKQPIPGAARKVLLPLALLIAGVAIVFMFFMTYVGPYEYGVKQVNVGIKKGIQDRVYETGFHLIKPFGLEFMHKFPKNLQVYEMAIEQSPRARRETRREKAARIQTSDGFYVDVDASIMYRIVDPVKVIRTIGPGRLFEDNAIIPKAEPALKDALGSLTTEEFYNSPLRVEKMLNARTLLNEQLLEPKGIEVEHVLIRYFQYSQQIQTNIEDKKLKDQLVFKNQAEASAAAEAATLMQVVQEGKANAKVKLEEGSAYVVRRNAERDLYSRTKHANADLLIKLAQAKATELKNTALRGAGSENMVGLKMAEVLRGLDVIILPSDGRDGVNPLDLNKDLELFSVKKGGK